MGTDPRTVIGVVTCGATAHNCVCTKPAALFHQVHTCDPGCGGSWTGDIDGDDFVVVTYPTGTGRGLPR